MPRLRDQNTKVSLQAQQAFQEMLPVIASFNDVSAVIKLAVDAICVNLRSRNVELRRSASCVLDAVIDHAGNDCKCSHVTVVKLMETKAYILCDTYNMLLIPSTTESVDIFPESCSDFEDLYSDIIDSYNL